MKVLVSLSCGKNSVSACKLYLDKGIEFDTVTYIPYLKDDIPLLDKRQFDFIQSFLERLRSLNVKTFVVKGMSYYDYTTRILTKGKNKGLVQSYPLFIKGKCGFARDSKIKSCQDFFKKNLDNYDFFDIGLCADELGRKKLKGKECSILQSLGIKDKDCFKIAKDFNALSPKYEDCSRDGCVLCPHASVAVRVRYFEDYPIAKEIVLDIQRRCLERGYYPLRGKHYFIENEEFHCGYGQRISLFNESYY